MCAPEAIDSHFEQILSVKPVGVRSYTAFRPVRFLHRRPQHEPVEVAKEPPGGQAKDHEPVQAQPPDPPFVLSVDALVELGKAVRIPRHLPAAQAEVEHEHDVQRPACVKEAVELKYGPVRRRDVKLVPALPLRNDTATYTETSTEQT